MSCECRGSSYEIHEDPQALWLELGPAYEDVSSAEFSVEAELASGAASRGRARVILPRESVLCVLCWQYRAGNVSVSRTWEPNKGLVGDWLPTCCGELRFAGARPSECVARRLNSCGVWCVRCVVGCSGDWTYDDLWLPHTIMLAFYIAISGSLLGIMIYLREQQPFKFRDMRAVTVLWLVITFCMINGVMAGNMVRKTAQCHSLGSTRDAVARCRPPAAV